MARKLQDRSLDFLYALDKITSTAEKAIRDKEDFSSVKSEYCNKVCKFACKLQSQIPLVRDERVDLVIIQDNKSPPDKWKNGQTLDRTHYSIFKYLIDKHVPDVKWVVLNTLKCIPTQENMKVKDVDIQRCSPYLREELKRLSPKVIICTGTPSSKAIGVNKSVYSCRGEIYSSEFGPVILTLHPKSLLMLRQNASGAFWGPDYLSCLEGDIVKAKEVLTGTKSVNFDLDGSIARVKENQISICRTNEEVSLAIKAIMAFPKNRVISFDTETTGLDPWALDAKLLCIQFGWIEGGLEKAVVIPLWHRENKTVNPDMAWDEVSKLLLSDRPKAAHHGKFDIKYINVTKGIRVVNVLFDTMLLLHEINSGIQGNYGLKKAAWDYMWDTGIAGYEDLLPSLSKEEEIEEDSIGTEEI